MSSILNVFTVLNNDFLPAIILNAVFVIYKFHQRYNHYKYHNGGEGQLKYNMTNVLYLEEEYVLICLKCSTHF